VSFQRRLYRVYRRSKNYFQQGDGIPSKAFFVALGIAEWLLSENLRLRKDDAVWRKSYKETYGDVPLFRVHTKFPVASASTDHISPRGAVRDNTVHPAFNRALHRVLAVCAGVKVLDLGCAGGGFVRSFLEDGDVAVGIEGSDLPQNHGLGEWRNIPLHLFTADICQSFEVKSTLGDRMHFDAITAWEVLEHIPEPALPVLAENISMHLRQGGLFIASVDSTPDRNPLTGAVYHVTLRPKEWWTEMFSRFGLVAVNPEPFRKEEYARGNALGLKNWDPDAGDGFHLVLQKN